MCFRAAVGVCSSAKLSRGASVSERKERNPSLCSDQSALPEASTHAALQALSRVRDVGDRQKIKFCVCNKNCFLKRTSHQAEARHAVTEHERDETEIMTSHATTALCKNVTSSAARYWLWPSPRKAKTGCITQKKNHAQTILVFERTRWFNPYVYYVGATRIFFARSPRLEYTRGEKQFSYFCIYVPLTRGAHAFTREVMKAVPLLPSRTPSFSAMIATRSTRRVEYPHSLSYHVMSFTKVGVSMMPAPASNTVEHTSPTKSDDTTWSSV